MDALTRLQQKNDKHKVESERIAKKDKLEFTSIVLMISPLLFSYIYQFYYWFNGHELDYSLLWTGLGTLGFGIPAHFLINFQLFQSKVKFLILLLCTIWFSYFWVVVYLSWFAFFPLLFLYGLLLKNRKEISNNLHSDVDI